MDATTRVSSANGGHAVARLDPKDAAGRLERRVFGARTRGGSVERPRTGTRKSASADSLGSWGVRRATSDTPSQQSQHATSRRGGVRPRRRAPATGAMAEEKVSTPTEHVPYLPSVRARITGVARPPSVASPPSQKGVPSLTRCPRSSNADPHRPPSHPLSGIRRRARYASPTDRCPRVYAARGRTTPAPTASTRTSATKLAKISRSSPRPTDGSCARATPPRTPPPTDATPRTSPTRTSPPR